MELIVDSNCKEKDKMAAERKGREGGNAMAGEINAAVERPGVRPPTHRLLPGGRAASFFS